MSEEMQRRRDLWRLLDQNRGQISFASLPTIVEGLEQLGEALDYNDLASLSQHLSRHLGGRSIAAPSHVCRFISELLASRESLSVLDPVAGEGWLAARISSIGHAMSVVAVTEDAQANWLADKLQLNKLVITADEPSTKFDAIVSLPPVGLQRERRTLGNGKTEIYDVASLIRMLESAELLSEDGFVAWVVSPRFAYDNSSRSVRKNLHRFGLHLSGLLQIPRKDFSHASVDFELALIERTPRDKLFVGRISEDQAAQDELITRFRARKNGPQSSQGRLVKVGNFFGLDALEAEERARRLSERRGMNSVLGSIAIVEINRPRHRGREFERYLAHPDAVYLPEMARTDAATDQDALPENLKYYLQLIVDREQVHPEYLAGLLNTPLGHAIRESATKGVIPRIDGGRFLEATLYLPPLADQLRATEALDSIGLLLVELKELREQVWERPRKVEDTKDRIASINHEDRFKDWVETLPFPLASILRAYDAVERTKRQKYERLLHFFEALAAFTAPVHLSALRNDQSLWQDLREKLGIAFESQNFTWSRPTFGMWRAVIESAAPLVRGMLNDKDTQAHVMSLYETADEKPIQFLVAKSLIALLQKTNPLRNRWSGHGGAVSDGEAATRHEEIAEHLNTFRTRCGPLFLRYQTIEPREPKILPGPVFQCPVRVVMGSNPQFEHVDVELLSPPVTGGLYLHNPGHNRALELLRLVQVQQAPQPVCYFYNRQDGNDSHFVSYHYGDRSDSTDESGTVASLITDLSSPIE